MSVHYDKARKHWFVRYREQSPSGSVQRTKRGFATKREAVQWETLREERNQYVTFSDLLNEYMLSLKGYSNEETITRKRATLEKYASEFFDVDVRRIDRKALIGYTNKLADLPVSLVTKNKAIQYFKAVSKYGAELGYPDFASSLRAFPRRSSDVKTMNILTPYEFDQIAQCVPNAVYRAFYIFLYHTGVRRGEAIALQKSDIVANTASINKSMKHVTGGFRPLKNASSKRIVTLDKYVLEAIKPLMSLEGDFLFGGVEPLPITNIDRHWKTACDRAGIKRVRIHDLRHSFVSNAIGNGVDVVTVSKYVGHASVTQTLNTYSHILKENEQKMIATLENLYV